MEVGLGPGDVVVGGDPATPLIGDDYIKSDVLSYVHSVAITHCHTTRKCRSYDTSRHRLFLNINITCMLAKHSLQHSSFTPDIGA